MIRTYGSQPTTLPKGFFKAVHFPVLANLDTTTGDHRRLASEGAGTRDLPLSIKFQAVTSYGHEGATVSGALFEVTVDPDNKITSGKGFLLDDPNGRTHARYIHTQAMRGNSIDTVEVKARLVEELDSEEWYIEFSEWKIGATTGVATPAFGDAHAVIPDGMTDEELTAALGDDPMVPLVVQVPEAFSVHVVGQPEVETELTAGVLLAPYDAFFQPEPDVPQKTIISPEGWVSGHLGLWNTCHDGRSDKCLIIPRPTDGYASFNKPGPLTEKGRVNTGPIFAFGGHRPAKSAKTIEEAYGGIENSWCDVRITEGRLGPWMSGFVRPGVPEGTVYAVNASRVSGHWVGDRLKAVVSVNAEGFDVPGATESELELVAGFAFHTDAEGVSELVASFPECAAVEEPERVAANVQAEADALLLALLLEDEEE